MAIPTNAFAAVAEELNAQEPIQQEQVVEPVEEILVEEATTEEATTEEAVAQEDVVVPEEVAEEEAAVESEEETEEALTQEEIDEVLDEQSDRCTGMYIGSDLTETGDTFIGRSEDLNGNNRKVFEYVPASKHNPETDFYTDVDSCPLFKLPMPEETVGYTAVHDDPAEWGVEGAKAYAANGINDYGVAITATTTTYMNEAADAIDPEVADSGLAECVLGDILLGQAKSPKDACLIAGKIIDEHGAAEGYQFYAGNSEETWMFSTLSGHQWVAFRIPNDKVMVNPNIGGLQYEIDYNDTDNVIYSTDMFKLAKDNGFDQYFEDGTFNAFATYGNYTGGSGNNGSVNSRLWQGYRYLTGSDEAADALIEDHPLFFTPDKVYSTFDALRMLGYQGKGTKIDSTDKIKGWMGPWGEDVDGALCRAAFEKGYYPIGNLNQLQCHVFQVRHDKDIPLGLRTIQWQCMGSAAYGVFLPFYCGLQTEMPDIYNAGPVGHDYQGALVSDVDAENSMYYVMTDYSKLVAYCVNAGADMSAIEQYRDNMQKDLIAQQIEMEKAMMELSPLQYTAAANAMCNVLSNNLHQSTLALNSLLRAYINAGDFSKPFSFDFADQVLPNAVDTMVMGDDEPRQVKYDAGYVEAQEPQEPQEPQKEAKKATSPAKTPQTGDATNMLFPVVIAIAGASAVCVSMKKREEI